MSRATAPIFRSKIFGITHSNMTVEKSFPSEFGSWDYFSFFFSLEKGKLPPAARCMMGGKYQLDLYAAFKMKICIDSILEYMSPWARRIVAKHPFDIDWKYTLILRLLDVFIFINESRRRKNMFFHFNVYILSGELIETAHRLTEQRCQWTKLNEK